MTRESPTGPGDATVVLMPHGATAPATDDVRPPVDSGDPQSPGEATPAPPPQVHRDIVVAQAEDEHLNTDDRSLYDWRGHYPADAQREIWREARVVGGIMLITYGALFLTWRGSAFDLMAGDCAACSRATFDRYAYFYLGGQLGGILFGVKYLYKVVARGRWHLDRRVWRYFSPFLSGGLAMVVGALTDSGVLGLTTKATSGAAFFSLGFIAGYFADSALAKMQEIADTVFGSPARRKHAPPSKPTE